MNKKKGIDLSTINTDDTPILRKRQKKRLVEEKKKNNLLPLHLSIRYKILKQTMKK